jgi:F0F1-type ATP synthase gamma subunit
MKSVGSISKITKAMKMVATAKMKVEVFIIELNFLDEKIRGR